MATTDSKESSHSRVSSGSTSGSWVWSPSKVMGGCSRERGMRESSTCIPPRPTGRSPAAGSRSTPVSVLTRSHSVLSSAVGGIEVPTATPDTPDEGERFGHAVPQGVHLGLAHRALAGVVRGDDGVVLHTDHGHPVERGAEVGIAGLGHVPARLRVGALATRAGLARMDTRVREQLVDVGEPEDVADLGK